MRGVKSIALSAALLLGCAASADAAGELVLGDSLGVGVKLASGHAGPARLSQFIRNDQILAQIAQVPNGATAVLVLGTNDSAGSVKGLDRNIDNIIQAVESRKIKLVWVGPPCVRKSWDKNSRELGDQFERDGSAAVAKTYGNGPSRVPFAIKDARGFAEFQRHLAEHDAQGSAHTSRGFQGARPSLYDFEDAIKRLAIPALIVVGDEDDRCIEPSLFLKQTLPAAGLVMFPKSGHVVNLEEPDLFNSVVGEFLARVEAGRWAVRDPRTKSAEGVIPMRG